MVVLPHEYIAVWISSLFEPTSRKNLDSILSARDHFNAVMLGVFIVLLLSVFTWLYLKAQKEDLKILTTYSLITGILIIACIKIILVANVEAIHFVQYALFAIICFQLTHHYFRTMFWSVLAGAVDELYQYVWLAPDRTDYYDFNDVIINTIGAGIGLIVIRTLRRPVINTLREDFLRSTEFLVALGIVILIGVGLVTGVLSYGPSEEALFCFMKVEEIGFWKVDMKVYKFHIVKPLEGVIITIGLILFYSGLKRAYERNLDDI